MRTGYKVTAGNASVITVFFTQHTEFVRADAFGFFGTGKAEDEALQSLLRSIQGSGVKIWQRDVMLKGSCVTRCSRFHGLRRRPRSNPIPGWSLRSRRPCRSSSAWAE